MRIPISLYTQVLKYEHLEHYSAHHDFFDPAAYASNKEMLASVEHGAKNRLATVFFCMRAPPLLTYLPYLLTYLLTWRLSSSVYESTARHPPGCEVVGRCGWERVWAGCVGRG